MLDQLLQRSAREGVWRGRFPRQGLASGARRRTGWTASRACSPPSSACTRCCRPARRPWRTQARRRSVSSAHWGSNIEGKTDFRSGISGPQHLSECGSLRPASARARPRNHRLRRERGRRAECPRLPRAARCATRSVFAGSPDHGANGRAHPRAHHFALWTSCLRCLVHILPRSWAQMASASSRCVFGCAPGGS